MKYKEFIEKQELTELFNLNNPYMITFLKDRLLRLKPQEANDIEGWVYCYYRKLDLDMLKNKRLSHLLLYKVGRTRKQPSRRIYE